MTTPGRSFSLVGDHSYIGYSKIDLTGIRQVEFFVQVPPRVGAKGGTIEIHLDSPDGKLIGKTEMIAPKEIDFRKLMAEMNAKNTKEGKPGPPVQLDQATRRRMSSIQALAAVEATEGIHDLYFVFTNPTAKANQILMQMVSIQVQNVIATPKKP
ncbi:MAG: hypothetical protein DI538_19370 [Azospira oryzae]|nr:MAG: hypothetical protein DI538_19370 [Azospira oryzae]